MACLRQMNDSFDVAVVGLGPAGAVCAALLGEPRGEDARDRARARPVYDKPRAFALDHEVMRVFEDLGIADAVAPHTAPFTPSEYYGVDGPAHQAPRRPAPAVAARLAAEHGVRAAARSRRCCASGPPQVAEIAFTELDRPRAIADEDVRLRLRDGDTITARYVIGCDGAASTVRQALGIEYEDLEFDQEWLVVDLLVNERGLEKLPQVSIQYCEPARPSTYLIGVGVASALGADAASRRGARRLEAARALAHARRRAALARGLLSLPRAGGAPVAARPRVPRRRRRAPAAAVHRPGHVPGNPRRGQPELEAARYVLTGKADDRLLDTYEVERSAAREAADRDREGHRQGDRRARPGGGARARPPAARRGRRRDRSPCRART